ncbi:MAG: response regulator [Myxococcota bacterium]
MSKKRVLVVDDAIFMRNMIKDFSSEHFESGRGSRHGVEAVEKYIEIRPDFVTMDIIMPFKSGIEATAEIIEQDPAAIIIMCSALGQEPLVMEAIEAGASDFIVKPFIAEDVLRVVEKALQGTKRTK